MVAPPPTSRLYWAPRHWEGVFRFAPGPVVQKIAYSVGMLPVPVRKASSNLETPG
ncbi:hypothetical protein MJC1_01102 [Methylocystis sp. MJC1]|nr:hypothetical protein MJC1_01102 [Methylocystis sp. MJC1]